MNLPSIVPSGRDVRARLTRCSSAGLLSGRPSGTGEADFLPHFSPSHFVTLRRARVSIRDTAQHVRGGDARGRRAEQNKFSAPLFDLSPPMDVCSAPTTARSLPARACSAPMRGCSLPTHVCSAWTRGFCGRESRVAAEEKVAGLALRGPVARSASDSTCNTRAARLTRAEWSQRDHSHHACAWHTRC